MTNKMMHEEFTGAAFNDLDPSGTWISRLSEFSAVDNTEITLNITHTAHTFLPERACVTCRSLLSQIRLSVVYLSVTLVHPTHTVEAFGNISSLLYLGPPLTSAQNFRKIVSEEPLR